MISETGDNLAFLLGLPRSGTTLLCAMLGNHPEISCPPEPWIMLALESVGRTSHRHPADSQALGEAVREAVSGDTGIEAARAYAATVYNSRLRARGKSFLIDKTPRYYFILPYLKRVFPAAKLIWLQRNPMAVAASYKTTWGMDIPALFRSGQDNWGFSDFLIGLDRLCKFADEQGAAVHAIRYERLVAEPESALADVLKYLGLPKVAGLTHFEFDKSELASSYAGDKKIRSTSAPHKQSLDAWEKEFSTEDLQTLLDAIGSHTFRRLGYDAVLVKLKQRGVTCRGKPIADEWLQRAEDALLRRGQDIDYIASYDTTMSSAARHGLPPGARPDDSHFSLVETNRTLRIDGAKAAEKIETIDAELKEARQRLEEQSARAESLRESFESKTQEADELRQGFEAKLDDLNRLAQEREREVAEGHVVRGELGTARDALRSVRDELQAAHDRLRLTRGELRASQDVLAATRRELDAARIAAVTSRAEVAQLSQQLSARDNDVRLGEEGLRYARGELARAQEFLSGLQAERVGLLARAARLEAEVQDSVPLPWYVRLYRRVGRASVEISENVKFKNFFENVIIGRTYVKTRPPRPLPTISIVTPVYNCQGTIRETIESVLSQDYPGLEYIIVDGGSTDGTMDIIAQYGNRISRVISEPDQGMYDAIAKGFLTANGEVFGYLNADDLYEPGGLLRVAEYFRDRPRAQVIYHEDTVTVDGWKFPNQRQPHVDFHRLIGGHILYQDGVFFRRRAYFESGSFNRTMRLAGDWDLWTRMARRYALHRRPGHVSSFRVRAGQLSTDMVKYNAELDAARNTILTTFGLPGKIRLFPRRVITAARNAVERVTRRQKLFFPMNPATNPPPPGIDPPHAPGQPVCPLTGRKPDRLLFSTRDTRFGDPTISYVYYNSASDVALAYPPLSQSQLGAMYEKHYSNTKAEIIPPLAEFGSPYKAFAGLSPLTRRLLRQPLWLRIVTKLCGPWKDNTFEELVASLEGFVPITRPGVQFLDVGCFDGKLLDCIRDANKEWKTHGIEPNGNAVKLAREKGHEVWEASAEDAPYVVPDGMLFDVIFLGQTIEHVQDPPAVLRRLRGLLAPDGVLVLSTPNLDSRQIELFGPTWAHWHLPYHRTLFSKKSLRRLGACAELRLVKSQTYSHPYWSALSIQLNEIGLGGAVPHGQPSLSDTLVRNSLNLCTWSKILWDWRGLGDYIYVVLKKQE